MKNIKTTSLVLLLTLFAFGCPKAQAVAAKNNLPVYQSVISNVYLAYDRDFLAGQIKLANGAILNIVDYKTRDDNIIKTWQAGDLVVFSPDVHKQKLILKINRVFKDRIETQVEPYVIFDTLHSGKDMLSIVDIKEKGKFIKLSDDSVWKFGFYNQFFTEDWSIGERVLVSGGQDGKNSYTFINVDVPLQHNVYSATGSFIVD